MGMNLSRVGASPYIIPDGRGKVRKKEDEEKSPQAAQAGDEESGQQQQSKGLQYIEDRKPAPPPSYNQSMQFALPQKSAAAPEKTEEQAKAEIEFAQAENAKLEKTYAERQKSSAINIAQVLKDFRGTAAAIGTPEALNDEVEGYLALIDTQVRKDEPDSKIIRTNLKTAAALLDKFISKTLDKESKVVANWVDALFLQQIDFKYNEEDVNPQFLVKFPEGKSKDDSGNAVKPASAAQTQSPQPTPAQSPPTQTPQSFTPAPHITSQNAELNVELPEDKQLKSTFLQAKKLAFANDPKKAIQIFQKALVRAKELDDTQTESKIFFEVGKIYDDYDYLPQALKSYNNAVTMTSDNNVKTKAHFSMGQIYDEANHISPALDHYFNSISFGGEAENLVAQSTALAKIGNIYTDMFEDTSLDYYTTAQGLAVQTDNAKIKGYVESSLAGAYEQFGEPKKAMQSYSSAIQHYTESDSPDKVAQNYVSAAEIMLDYNNEDKAVSMLRKAQSFAEKAGDAALQQEIEKKLTALSV